MKYEEEKDAREKIRASKEKGPARNTSHVTSQNNM